MIRNLDEEASNRDASRDEFVQSRDEKLTRQRAGKSSPNAAPGRSDDGKPLRSIPEQETVELLSHTNRKGRRQWRQPSNLNEEASDYITFLCRSEVRNGKKVFTKPRYDVTKSSATGGWKGKTDKECFRCARITYTGAECKAKTHVKGGPPKSATRRKMCWIL